jgi:RNA polymerase sigma-70 factor (ECF subfamily)
MSTDEDTDLVRACRAGHTQAFDTLLARYEKPVFNAALRMLGDEDDAKDVTQTAFLKAFEHLDRFDAKYKFYSWIYRIALNESINLLKGRKGRRPLDERWPSDWRGPEQITRDQERHRRIQEALMQIQPDYRSVIILRHFLECSYREMGQILELPEKTVKSRLYTARQRLREVLGEKGLL